MRYDTEAQRRFSFTDCCESLEKLIDKGWAKLHMLERHSHALGIIAMHRHYDTERADKILEHARTVALEHEKDLQLKKS